MRINYIRTIHQIVIVVIFCPINNLRGTVLKNSIKVYFIAFH